MVDLVGIENFIFKPSYVGGDLTVSGNMVVQGTNANLNVSSLSTNANFLTLNVSSSGGPSANTAGLELNRGSSTAAILQWNNTSSHFEAGTSGSLSKVASQEDINTALDLIAPPGMIMMFAGTSIPTGWLRCDGSAVSSGSYPSLATLIGTTYNIGGEGLGNFRLPNLKQRFPLGKSSTGTGSTLGGTGGAIDHTHTLNAHVHSMSHNHDATHTHTMGNHTHSYHSHRHTNKGTLTASTTNSSHDHRLPIQTTTQNGLPNVGLTAGGGFTDRVIIQACCQHVTNNDGAHSHALQGNVGNTGSAYDGDLPMNTIAISTNNTGGPNQPNTTSYTGNTDPNSDVTGSNNPAFIVLHFMIKT